MQDPEDYSVDIGERTFVELLTVLLRELSAEHRCEVGPNSFLVNTSVQPGDGYVDVSLRIGKRFRIWVKRQP